MKTDAHTAYPIVADPHYTWGLVTGTVYFNKHETSVIAAHVDWISVMGLFAPWPWSDLLATYASYIHTVAQHAQQMNMCVDFKSTGTAGIYGGSDGDGYCR